jgi:hypothetical protein
MTTITVNLDDNKAKSLEHKAERYGVPVEDLVAASVTDLVNQADPDFERAIKRVISENRELYDRLA